MRTFISFNLDDEVKGKISDFRSLISEKLRQTNPDALKNLKWEDEAKFHITLFFIGEIRDDKLREIQKGLSGIKAFTKPSESGIKITNVNAFPNFRYPRVLILDISDESGSINVLSDSISKLMKEQGFISDKPFHPHVTLARVRRDSKVNLTSLNNILLPEINLKINKFSLMESRLNTKGVDHIIVCDYYF